MQREDIQHGRLQFVSVDVLVGSGRGAIVMDTKTGVQYLIVSSANGVAVTPVLDRDGKPLVGQ